MRYFSSRVKLQAYKRPSDNSRNRKVKRTEQVHYLLMSLKEAFYKFTEVNPKTKIGPSKFVNCDRGVSNHPPLVVLKEHTQLSVDFRPFIDQITCDSSEKTCMSRQCATCDF